MAGREGKTGLARVLPQKYWAENMKADGKKIGNRCKILLLDEDYTPDTESAPLDPSKAEWAWSLTPTTQASATQNFRGGELVKYTYTQGQYIIEGHIEKTEHFEPEQPKSGVEAALASGEFPSFEGKGDVDTPTVRTGAPAGKSTIIESSKKIDSALNKGALYNLKTEFPISGDKLNADVGGLLKSIASGGFPPSLENITGGLTDQIGLPDGLSELNIPGTDFNINLGEALKSGLDSIASGEGLSALSTVLGDQVGSQLTDVLNDKTSIFESQISNALGNVPGVGDITGQLSGKLNDVIGTTANELFVGALSGQVNAGDISSNLISQLSSSLQIDSLDLADGALAGVADSIVGEVFNSLSGSLPEGLDLNTIVPSLANQTKAGLTAGLDITPIEDMISGGDYGYSRKISNSLDKFAYKTNSAVKVNDVAFDPVTEQIIDPNELVDQVVDDVEVTAFTLYNKIQTLFSESVEFYVREGIRNKKSGLKHFPVKIPWVEGPRTPIVTTGVRGEYTPKTQIAFLEGTSKGYGSLVEIVVEEYKPFDYKDGFKNYSDVNALYPLKEEYDDIPDILADLEGVRRDPNGNFERNGSSIPNVGFDVGEALEVPFDTGELEDGIRELTEKILENNIAADDDITFDFSVALATYIVALCEKSITENSLAFKGRVRDLYFLGSNDELKSYGAVTRVIMRDILVDALGSGEDGISLTGRGSRGKKIKGITNTGEYNQKIKEEVARIQSVIGFGITDIQLIVANLKSFSGEMDMKEIRRELRSLREIDSDSQFKSFNSGKKKNKDGSVTTGNGSKIKIITRPLIQNQNTFEYSKSYGKITNVMITVEDGGQNYTETKPPTVSFVRNKFPKYMSKELIAAGYTRDEISETKFKPAKGDVIIRQGKVVGIDITDGGQGYFFGATAIIDTTHAKTASGEKFDLSITGGDVVGIGANYDPENDVITISYVDEQGNQIETSARATTILPVSESIGSNELVETKTVMDKDGEIQQIKKIENYQNLTQKIVKSIHKSDNIITSVSYETSYLTGLTRFVGIQTAYSSFKDSPLISETQAPSNSSGFAGIPDTSGTTAIFEFDNGSVAQLLYGPGGRIIKFEFNKPIEGINGMPEISIDSDTGTGFEVQLKIDLKKKSTSDSDTLDNQTIESINEQLYVDGSPVFGQSVVNVETDCIGETNQIVGYVEGEPYIGPYHIHPDTGVKMVGKKHSSSPHSIIYDTREESLSRTVRRMNSRPTPSNISTTTSGSTPTPTPEPTPTPTQTTTPSQTPAPSPSPSYTPPSTGY